MGAKITIPTRRAMTEIGSYTGDGNDNRNINIGVNLLIKREVIVIIKNAGTDKAVFKTMRLPITDLSYFFDATAAAADRIQALTATGFQVGTAAEVNTDTIVYDYIVFWEEA